MDESGGGGGVDDGRMQTEQVLHLLERSPGAWVHLACHHWVACCPSLDWEQRLRSEDKHKKSQQTLRIHIRRVQWQNNTHQSSTEHKSSN